jgi:multiple sugar transport system permease protein
MMARLLRDATAILVVAIFMFPFFWLVQTSIKPVWAMFDPQRFHWFDFWPTFENYGVTLSGNGPEAFNARWAFADTLIVAAGSTLVSLAMGLPAAFGLSRFPGRPARSLTFGVLFIRAIPPVALAVPLVYFLNSLSLYDSRAGLVLVHGLANLPVAVLVLKSFIDDLPREAEEAACLDGATALQTFRYIVVPAL